VWAPEHSEIRAESDGVIQRLVAEPNSTVGPGDILLETEDPLLASKVDVLAAELEEAIAEYHSLRSVKQVEADIVREKVAAIEADLALARQRLDELIIRSPAQGIFLVDRPQDLVGRYVRRGDRIGFVADLSHGTIRVAVTQASMGRIRERTDSVQVLLVERLDQPLTATISREVPAASFSIPSAALGVNGGGSLAVDPTDPSGTKTLEQVFHVELIFDTPVERLGGRTYVRFDHGTEPLGWQWYRRLRQLFLRRFDV
jgi:putative peptide zinc metalloprotease protein